MGPRKVDLEGRPADSGGAASPGRHLGRSTCEPTDLAPAEPGQLGSGRLGDVEGNCGSCLIILLLGKMVGTREDASGRKTEVRRGPVDQSGPLADQHDLERTNTESVGFGEQPGTDGYPTVRYTFCTGPTDGYSAVTSPMDACNTAQNKIWGLDATSVQCFWGRSLSKATAA